MSKGRRRWRSANNRRRRPAYVPMTSLQRCFRRLSQQLARSQFLAKGGFVMSPNTAPLMLIPDYVVPREKFEAMAERFREDMARALALPVSIMLRNDAQEHAALVRARLAAFEAGVNRDLVRP